MYTEQENDDHLCTVLINVVQMNRLSQLCLNALRKHVSEAPYSKVLKTILIELIDSQLLKKDTVQ